MTTPFTYDALHPAESIALDASAGTGKTYTLTTIALRLIANGNVQLEELLIVTFTNAATAELQLRLFTTLRHARDVLNGETSTLDPETTAWLTGGDDHDRATRHDRIQAALNARDDASIVTIHGFCQRMLTFVGVTAGMAANATVIDDDATALNDTLDDLTASVIAQRPPAETAFLTGAANLSRDGIAAIAAQTRNMAELRLVDDLWPDMPLVTFEAINAALDSQLQRWRDAVTNATATLPHDRQQLTDLVAAMLNDPYFTQPSRQQTYRPRVIPTVVDALVAFLSNPPALPPHPTKTGIPKTIQPNAPYLWFTAAAFANFDFDGTPPTSPLITVGEGLAAAHNNLITQARNIIAHAIVARYAAHRRRRDVLTYDDLLTELHAALTDPNRQEHTRRMLRTRYTTALIDEFQDTDQTQWGIFSQLFSPADPFVVIGDPKQAIYQFRGADVATYLRARDTMRHVYTLDTNWRSDTDHVASVNALFGTTGTFAPYGIDYTPSAATHANRLAGPAITSGIHLREIAVDSTNRQDVSQAVIDDIASFAVTLLHDTHTITDAGVSRTLSASDIAVLVRTNRLARAVQDALRGRGVPAVIKRGGSVFATAEAAAVHQLLAAITRPHDTQLVCGAAASDLFQTAPQLLAEIQDGTATGETHAEFTRFIEALYSWQAHWQQHGVFAAVMSATGMFHPDATQQETLTNIRHLAELLQHAAHTHELGPEGVVAWLAQKRAEVTEAGYRTADDEELRLGADTDAVTIATIHSAKGLEYPVVLAGDLWQAGPDAKIGLHVFTDPNAKPHPKPTLDLARPVAPATPRAAHTHAARDRQAEQLRLAYVALTRAAHATVVWSTDGKRDTTAPLHAIFHTDDKDTTYREAFTAIAARTNAPITTCQVTETPANRHEPARDDAPTITVRAQRRTQFDTPFRRTSFSALTRHQHAQPPSVSTSRSTAGDDDRDDIMFHTTADTEPLPLATFPRGTRAGNLLHSVFEHLDFATATTGTVTAALTRALTASRFPGLPVDDAVTGILAAIDTPLGAAFSDATLRQLQPADRADEMPFTIPLAHRQATVSLAQLAPILAQSTQPLITELAQTLDAETYRIPVRGFLQGSIDAVIRLPDHRYAVIDYKSNYIADASGATHLACYAPDTVLAQTMREHAYTLQALLYLVVTHRYLARRVAGYHPDTHLAGAGYLFLRGMIGPHTPVAGQQRYGVVHLNVEADLLDEVSRKLAAEEPR